MAETKKEIDARRAKRRRAAKIRRLKFLTVVFLIFAFIITAILSVTVLFPVKTIKVSGSRVYDEKTVIEAGAIKGENLITLSEKKLLCGWRDRKSVV